ncbi:hypothetical protein Psuf_083450 [Phytohabitans suffuscus]|uniref:Uncharacterized protein n=1 Tax=Phytohabitans suffuscus TaxID=624315 RepID=A0A6F8YY83_9ACTN|nr:hypothetical protein Psuf_083450 [Phytohabitans suffuscus]
MGLREGQDFTIHPDRPDRQLPLDELSGLNVILLCGPARNAIFDKVAAILPMRYSMTVGNDGRNVLMDRRREQRMLSSRQAGDSAMGPAHDWGLVASLPSPFNLGKRLVVLAGVHGTGTVGAAEFVADLSNLRTLIGKREGETVSEVVRVDYDAADIETPTRIGLV